MTCEQCAPEQLPVDFWKFIHSLDRSIKLVDDSHNFLRVTTCKACGQQFADVWTEFVCFNPGQQDAQYATLIPLEDDEAQQLIAQGDQPDLQWLGALADGRRSLQRDVLMDGSTQYAWREGKMALTWGY